MEFINNIYFNALGLTLIHSLWQGLLIGLLFFIAKNLFSQYPARLRFRIGAFALVAQFIFAVATFIILLGTFSQDAAPSAMVSDLTSLNFSINASNTSSVNFWLSVVGLLWCAGTLFYSIKLSRSWWMTRQLRTMAQPVSEHWQKMSERIAAKMNLGKTIPVLNVANIHVPFTMGFLKPIILFPFGMINHLSTEEVEAIIAHELAHIKYQDYLLNLLFSAIEALFYFHPIVWWIASEINDAREESCDELAIELVGDRLQYARTLLQVQESSNFYLNTGLALSGKKGHLTKRIYKILNMPLTKKNEPQRFIGFIVIGILSSILWMGASHATKKEQQLSNGENYQVHLSSENGIKETIDLEAKTTNSITSQQEQKKICITSSAAPDPDNPNKFSWVKFDTNLDTIPENQQKSVTISKNIDGVETKVKMKNNKITFLMLDGKIIPKQDYDQYEDQVSEFLNATPPPAPPAPPAPPISPIDAFPPPPPPAPKSFEHLSDDFGNDLSQSLSELLENFDFDYDFEFHPDSTWVFMDSDAMGAFDMDQLENSFEVHHLNVEELKEAMEIFKTEHLAKMEERKAEIEEDMNLFMEEHQGEIQQRMEEAQEKVKRLHKERAQKMKEMEQKRKELMKERQNHRKNSIKQIKQKKKEYRKT